MLEYRIRKGRPIAAELTTAGDKSISHRAVLLAALANGPCVLSGFLPSQECMATVSAVRSLGVRVEELSEDPTADEDAPYEPPDDIEQRTGSTRLKVHGNSMTLRPPAGVVDCGSSGTAMLLLAGALSGQAFESVLTSDAAVFRSTLPRIREALGSLGTAVDTGGTDHAPQVHIYGNPNVKPTFQRMEAPDAQVKGALLLAGLFAPGRSTITEPYPTRDHTERMMQYFLLKTARSGLTTSVYGGQIPESRDFHIPGDFSIAANWIAATAAQTGSEIMVRDTGLNETRTTLLRILVRMGAQVYEDIKENRQGEPRGNVIVRGVGLRGTVIEGREIPLVIDEIPVLAVAAALATGRTIIRDAQSLRTQETDRLAAITHNLRLMGVQVRELFDGIEIMGTGASLSNPTPLKAATLPSHDDPRIGMAFAVAALFADGESTLTEASCVDLASPGFAGELKRFQSREISHGIVIPVISTMPSTPH